MRGMDGAGGVPQDNLDAERSAASKEARERNALLEERDVSETETGCPSCGAPAPCSTWLKITLGFTAAKAVARFLGPTNILNYSSSSTLHPR